MTNAIPFQVELKEFFQQDADSLMKRATELFTPLTSTPPALEQTQELRNVFHGMRGAAAAVGAGAVQRFIEEVDRLLEVADTFKFASVERALAIYTLLAGEMPQLQRAIQCTINEQFDEAEAVYQTAHARFFAAWGDYLYDPSGGDNEDEAEPTHPLPAADAPVLPLSKTPGVGRDAESMAASFLEGLGGGNGGANKSVKTPRPAPAAPVPVPVRAAEPARKTNPPARPARIHKAPVQAATPAPEAATPEVVDPEMLAFFVQETNEALEGLETTLLDWEKNPLDRAPAHTLFRIAHTIKGAANSIGLAQIGGLMHRLEDLLESHVVDRAYARQNDLVSLVFGIADAIKGMVREAQGAAAAGSQSPAVAGLLARIDELTAETPSVATPAPRATETAPTAAPPGELSALEPTSELAPASAERAEAAEDRTIRVESDQLDLLMNLTGELVIGRSRLEANLADIGSLRDEWQSCRSRLVQLISDFQNKHEYSRNRQRQQRRFDLPLDPASHPEGRPADARMDLTGFSDLEFDQYDEFNILSRSLMEVGTDTAEIFNQLTRFQDSFIEGTGQFSKITSQLQDEITRTRMVPLAGLLRRLKRAVRDAAIKENKVVEFVAEGAEARMDKIIADQVYTPLMHAVRNCVAHGIESAAVRQAAGKPATGQVTVSAYYEANQVVIEIDDDGRGLDYPAIRRRGLELGLLAADAPNNHETLANLIFQPGFSTATSTTDVAGRGVGLDVLRREISRLNGSVHVESETGQGCTLVVHLPLTLSINQAMLIDVGGETYAVPLNFIERVQESTGADIELAGEQELFKAGEALLPLLRLHQVLGLPVVRKAGAIILVRVADRRLALCSDRILRKQEIVVKSLGGLLGRTSLFSGATLSGSGAVLPILDLPNLLQVSQSRRGALRSETGSASPASSPASDRPEVLVVDDSLSIRKVMEKHLLASGMNVHLAVDGLDALEYLRSHPIDLVLTDLEMPRMHGFELIAEMRRQPSLAGLPVIVVTSRDAEKHRRRARELGANGFIVKPFSREQLVEHIERLLGATTTATE